MWMRVICLSLGLCWLVVRGWAAEPTPNEFECRFATGPIAVDGVPEEAAWKAAQTIDHFYLPWLGADSRPSKTSTHAKLLWDREALYFTAELEDADLFADIVEHDGKTWHNDVFEMFFKPAANKLGYYEFHVSAANTVMDVFFPERDFKKFDEYLRDDRFHIEAQVSRRGTLNQRTDDDEGWTVEGRIPWFDFLRTGGRPAVDERWQFALCRYDYSADAEQPELSTIAPLTQASFHRHEEFATLRFVGPTPQSLGARDAAAGQVLEDLKATWRTVSSRVLGSPDPPLPYRTQRVLPNLKLSFPLMVVAQPDTQRLLFMDQKTASYSPSRLCRMTEDPSSGEYEVLLDFQETAYSLAFHPQFAENGYLFIGDNGPGADGKKMTRVTRYTMDREPPYSIDPATALRIIEWPSDGHNGGAIAFGLDGLLYITSGDGTSDSDTDLKGQGLDHLLSKVLRIDVDHPADGQQYSVPSDNPFLKTPGARPETWAFGFRNPWRMTIDDQTGHVWVGNNGQDLWEQIFLVERGANYGWSVYEGGHIFYANRQLGPAPHSPPMFEHPHSEARSLTGGVVYRGQRFPELQGAYIYGDYSTGKIWGGKVEGRQLLWHKELADSTLAITGFGLDADGELLIADHQGNQQGGFYTLEPNEEVASENAFPQRLSETGLFASVEQHQLARGLIPYSVNAPLWSDGAYKSRYLYLPPTMKPDGDDPTTIEMVEQRGWNFPDRTVLVKSFALDSASGESPTRRWIETRLLTKQAGEWVGYSYVWNDEQTDATLVAKEGLDREYMVRQADGTSQRQVWHYPSRTECMVCHSRAANFVLGLSTLQMNKAHDYGGVTANQLEVLEYFGVLRVDAAGAAKAALRGELEKAGLGGDELEAALKKATDTKNQRAAPPGHLLAQAATGYVKLVDPYDATQDLTARARSYLHANCAQCHVGAGGGNSQIDLHYATAFDQTKLLDAEPLHHKFDLSDPRLVAPGHPERSVLLHRLLIRGPGQMPQLATSLVDEPAVELLREWIRQL